MSMVIFNVGIKGVIQAGDKILLVHGGKDRSFWDTPGGRMDDDETVEQTLRRELQEELPGIENIEVHEILYANRIPGLALGDKGLFLVWYRVTADFPYGVHLSDEHESYKWCTKAEARELLSVNTREVVDKL